MPNLATYSASKAAAWSYTNSSRIELKAQGTQVVGVHVGFVDTDLTAGFEVEKVSPHEVATKTLDALETGASEAIIDDFSATVKSGLADDLTHIYPGVQAQYDEAAAAAAV
jgi:short-subunit dehydrogenase